MLRSRAFGWALALACGACGASVAPATTTVTSAPRDDPAARLQRELDDANRRAVVAEESSAASRGECNLARHELSELRKRDNFEQSIWIRLDQADLTLHSLMDLIPQAVREQRKAIQRAVAEAAELRGAIERQLRRLHGIPDVEWAQFEHDLSSEIDALERALHPLL